MNKTTSELPSLGKIPPGFFDQVIRSRLGKASPAVLVGPKNGVDCGVIDIGNGRVMALSTDPFFVVPSYGWKRAAWFAVHIIASDVATSGLTPEYMSIDLNLPPSMTEGELSALWEATHDACKDLGIAVVTGHTGRYEGCNYPMLGGCTVMATGPSTDYVSVGMSQPDDRIVLTKGAAIEAAGLMAATFPRQVEAALGKAFTSSAQELFWKMSTVKDAATAVSVGVREQGVTAMHDATECGVIGGLFEMARAAGTGMDIQHESIPVAEQVQKLCELFDMDPYTAISEGSLLMTCRPHVVNKLLRAFEEAGIVAAEIGACSERPGLRYSRNGETRQLEHPREDPFWRAFAAAAAREAQEVPDQGNAG